MTVVERAMIEKRRIRRREAHELYSAKITKDYHALCDFLRETNSSFCVDTLTISLHGEYIEASAGLKMDPETKHLIHDAIYSDPDQSRKTPRKEEDHEH